MTVLADDIRLRVVRPALTTLGLWSATAETLDLATAAHESGGFVHREQIGGGPALGLWQIEPFTANDTLDWLAGRHRDLLDKLNSLANNDLSEEQNLRDNDLYGAAFCRLIYFRKPFTMIEDASVEWMAAIWGRWYQGRSDPVKEAAFIADYARYVAVPPAIT